MATTFLSPICNGANFSVSGVPASGYKLFTYTAGTTTKQTTYQDNAGATPNANPIILSSQGYPSSGGAVVEIWLTQGVSYKFVMAPSTDTDPPSSPIWTRDDISGVNDPGSVVSALNEWIIYSAVPTFISATSFSVAGDQRSIFQIDRKVKTTNTSGTVYSLISNSTFGSSITTVTVVNDSGTLDSGLSAVSYGLIAAGTTTGLNRSLPAINSVQDLTDPSKKVNFGFGNITTGTTRTISLVPTSSICNGRLTLTTGVAVTTSDVTAATTIFFTPFKGNVVATYSGTNWSMSLFTEKSLTIPSVATTMYDVFLVDGTLALEALAWTNDTTRATLLTTQDGVLVKTGDATRRYLGSFRTVSSGQTEDSLARRFVWNYENRVTRKMLVQESTASWNYTTATYRQANANTANQLDMAIGVSEDIVKAYVGVSISNTGALVNAQVGIGLDAVNVNNADIIPASASLVASSSGLTPCSATYSGFPGVGRHFLAWTESSLAAGTTTWTSKSGITPNSQAGITGEIRS